MARRLTALLALLALSVIGLLQERTLDVAETGPEWDAAAEVSSTFGLREVGAVLAVFDLEASPDSDAALRALEARVEALDAVVALVTPFDVPGIDSLEEARRHPIASRSLAPPGGLLLPLVPADPRAGAGWQDDVLTAARAGAAEMPRLDVGLTGQWPIVQAQQDAYARERIRFQLLGVVVGIVISSLAFRTLRATLLAGLPPVVGVVLAVGVGRLLGLGHSGLSTLVLPLLVLTIGFTDSLHLVVAAVRARRGGAPDGTSAVLQASRELLRPCALTSLTTAIGFGSLATAGNAVAVDFGLTCALATALSFAAVFLTLPLLARTGLGRHLDRVAIGEDGDRGGPGGRVVERVLGFVIERPGAVSLIAVAATLACGFAASRLGVDRRVENDLARGSAAIETLGRVDRELGGVLPIHVQIDWETGVQGPAVLRAAGEVSAALEAVPYVSGALGPAELAASVGGSWPAVTLLPERWRGPFLQLEKRSALVHARLPDAGSAELEGAFEQLARSLEGVSRDGIRTRIVGDHYAYLLTVGRVTRDLARSLVLAAALILVTLAAAFRSWRLGLASMVPNLLPITASAAGLHLLGRSIDISALTALTLSLGIATDDTIHVLSRWQRARAGGDPLRAAARRAVLRSYPALVVTTLTLGAAFALLLSSSIPAVRDFGLLAFTTLVVALLADVWLLPALLIALEGRDGRGESG